MSCKSILFLVIILGSYGLTAQTMLYGGMGYNVSFVNSNAVDFVIDRYNQTRPFLVEEMDEMKVMHWPAAVAGVITAKGVTVELNWVGRQSTSEAIGEGSVGARERWDIQIRDNHFGIVAGYTYNKDLILKPGILFSLDMGSFKELSRVGLASEIERKDFKLVDKEFTLGSTISINLLLKGDQFPLAAAIRPYFHIDYIQQDLTSLNQAINPNTYVWDNEADQRSPNHHFGLQAFLIVALNK